jgi:nifR3 family TIM-barrel protein
MMNLKFINYLNTPLRVGSRTIPKRLILTPMSGLTHVAFRELVARFGGYGLLYTEMCSAKTVPHENRYVSPVFRWRDSELPELVCQLFGSEPEVMATAARRVEAEGFFGVDMNFGCSVAAICKRHCGAALLKTPDLALDIVKAVRRAVSIPLIVKFRTGWEDAANSPDDLARRFEDAGADALIFHPRTAPDRRSRPPKWEHIARVKEAVAIPVFGNGEVFCEADAEKMLAATGCDGIALGRIAIAKPWVFTAWTDGFTPDADIYRRTIKHMLALLNQHYEPVTAVRKFKKAAVYVAALFKYGHSFYKRLHNAGDVLAIQAEVDAFFDKSPELAQRPNMNLFR